MAVFVTFEGVDGAGKSTQLSLLEQYLNTKGLSCLFTGEPGAMGIGGKIRSILLDPADELTPLEESFLFAADRAQHVRTVISPALQANINVICSRYVESNYVYQGYVGGVSLDFLEDINELAMQGIVPDLTIVLDVPASVAKERRTRPNDRIERKGEGFHNHVRLAYRALASKFPERIMIVNAAGSIAEVQQEIRELIDPYFQ